MQQWQYEAWYKDSDHSIRTYSWDCLGFSVVPIFSAQVIKLNYFLYSSPGGSAFRQCCNNSYCSISYEHGNMKQGVVYYVMNHTVDESYARSSPPLCASPAISHGNADPQRSTTQGDQIGRYIAIWAT